VLPTIKEFAGGSPPYVKNGSRSCSYEKIIIGADKLKLINAKTHTGKKFSHGKC